MSRMDRNGNITLDGLKEAREATAARYPRQFGSGKPATEDWPTKKQKQWKREQAKRLGRLGGAAGRFAGRATVVGGAISTGLSANRGFAGDGFRPEGGTVAAVTEVGRDVCMVEEVNGGVSGIMHWFYEITGLRAAQEKASSRITDKIRD